jgi:hypothetical protein
MTLRYQSLCPLLLVDPGIFHDPNEGESVVMYVFDLLGRTSIFSTRSYPKGSILIGPMAEVVVVLQIRRSRNNLRSSITELGHSALQKGLAFGRDWSGTVVRLGRQGCSEIPPRRLYRRCGASVVRRDAVMSRMEDLNVKVCQEAITCKIAVVGEGGKVRPTVR